MQLSTRHLFTAAFAVIVGATMITCKLPSMIRFAGLAEESKHFLNQNSIERRLQETLDPYQHIVRQVVSGVGRWFADLPLDEDDDQLFVQEFSHDDEMHDADTSCIDNLFFAIRTHVPQSTNPAYIEWVLESMGLSESYLIRKHLHDYLQSPQDLSPLFDESSRCLKQIIGYPKFACTVRDNVDLNSIVIIEQLHFLEYLVNFGAVLEVLTSALTNDLVALHEVIYIMAEEQSTIVEEWYADEFEGDRVDFAMAKYTGVAWLLKSFGRAMATNTAVAEYVPILGINILEAVLLDSVLGFENNARVGLALASALSFEGVIDDHDHKLKWRLGEEWIGGYMTWNTAFVLGSIPLHVLPKLLIPSTTCSATANQGEDWVLNRVISLALALMSAGIVEPSKEVSLPDLAILSVLESFSSIISQQDDSSRSILAEKVGESNIKTLLVPIPTKRKIEVMLNALCGGACSWQQDTHPEWVAVVIAIFLIMFCLGLGIWAGSPSRQPPGTSMLGHTTFFGQGEDAKDMESLSKKHLILPVKPEQGNRCDSRAIKALVLHSGNHTSCRHNALSTNENKVQILSTAPHESATYIKKPSNEQETNSILMSWSDITCIYPSRRKDVDGVQALKANFGQLRFGEVTAIMGPSGSGKSTLLNVLSGKKSVGIVTGQFDILGKTLHHMSQIRKVLQDIAAFIPQEVSFFPMQTPEEAVLFVATLKNGKSATCLEQVQKILHTVGLEDPSLYSRPIGGVLAGGLKIQGLSFGERKRLALACALAMEPKVMMLDEITSGLDSENALLTMKLLKQICVSRNVAAAAVIHQPNGYVYQTFGRLILLSGGECVFSNDATCLDKLYRHRFGCDVPDSMHEIPMDLLRKLQDLPEYSRQSIDFQDTPPFAVSCSSWTLPQRSIPLHLTFLTVFHRNFTNHYVRNLTNLAARLSIYAAVSLITGCLFWQVGSGDDSVSSVIGAYLFVCLASYVLPFATIPVFVNEKAFYLTERSHGLYTPWIYCLVQMILEFWILTFAATLQGCIVIPMCALWNDELPGWASFFTSLSVIISSGLTGSALTLFFSILMNSQDLAFLASACVVTISLGVSGGFVQFSSIPSPVQWLQWVSPCKYSLQGLTIGFFQKTNAEFVVRDAELNEPSTVSANIGVLFIMYMAFAISTVIVLGTKRERC